MPWPTYSERFLHHQAAGSWVYTVPANMRAVVTNLDAISGSAEANAVVLYIGPILLDRLVFPAAWTAQHAVMRAVAYAGENIAIDLQHSGMYTTVSGYLFADNSGRTGPPLAPASKPIRPERPEPEPMAA